MERFTSPLTPELARAGRALTRVSVDVIAMAAELDSATVRAFEQRGTSLGAADNHRLRDALEEYGVVFFGEDSYGGNGVRLKHTASKVRQLQNWEAEGGPAYEDDI